MKKTIPIEIAQHIFIDYEDMMFDAFWEKYKKYFNEDYFPEWSDKYAAGFVHACESLVCNLIEDHDAFVSLKKYKIMKRYIEESHDKRIIKVGVLQSIIRGDSLLLDQMDDWRPKERIQDVEKHEKTCEDKKLNEADETDEEKLCEVCGHPESDHYGKISHLYCNQCGICF